VVEFRGSFANLCGSLGGLCGKNLTAMPEPWFFTSKSTMPAQRTGLQIACIHAWEAFEEYRQLQNLGKTKPGFLDVF
jgi:hypothetical protein